MPLLSLHTNASFTDEQQISILTGLTQLIAQQTGKPESVTMVKLHTSVAMSFGGDPTASTVLFEMEGIELSASDHAEALTKQLCDYAEAEMHTSASRVFVKLHDVPRGNWGGNHKVY